MKNKNFFVILMIISVAFFASCKKSKTENPQPIPTPPPVTTHTVGESFGGGIIFYVDTTGKHGLIAATSDQGTAIWSSKNVLFGTDTSFGSGLLNTQIIFSNDTGNFAAKICYQLVLNGFSDWYLPSKDELNLMCLKKSVIGGFSGAYWSSSEYSETEAWVQLFGPSGAQGAGTKNDVLGAKIRPIRAF